jgi:hypothetical protein
MELVIFMLFKHAMAVAVAGIPHAAAVMDWIFIH